MLVGEYLCVQLNINIIKHPKFSRAKDLEFSETLKKRVNLYFKTNGISKYANLGMYLKTALMLTMFIGPLIVLNLGLVASPALVFSLYIISGLGTAGIGMCVMHDANHGSYSKNKWINRALSLTMNMIGANATSWRIQHNVLHHSYTNINDADNDLNQPSFLRFDPHKEHHHIHQYQYLYFWFFYGLSTISWITAKDFVKMKQFKALGFLNKKHEYAKAQLNAFLWKLAYYTYALVIPLIMLPVSAWVVVLAFLSMHFVTGLALGFIFQMAHIMPSLDFPVTDEDGQIDNNWAVHQLLTTTNFCPDQKVFTWLVGGLNYQVEHHLLPHICHVHYRKLAPIVKQTAEEYGIPYHSKPTFGAALKDHVKMLYQLGRPETHAA
jgi:linoleoyl-CoA desaturase